MVGVGKVNRTCLCGSIDFDRVTVARPGAAPYRTAFIECRHCRVMYHSPSVPDPPSPFRVGGPVIVGRDEPTGPRTLDPALMAAVARANKSKGRR